MSKSPGFEHANVPFDRDSTNREQKMIEIPPMKSWLFDTFTVFSSSSYPISLEAAATGNVHAREAKLPLPPARAVISTGARLAAAGPRE